MTPEQAKAEVDDIRSRGGEYRFSIPNEGLEVHKGGVWRTVHVLHWEPMLDAYERSPRGEVLT